ncbi:hypothetical protein LTR10_005788 [Elasticomyces elasticus]|nr:hypothetical protein LTR10_005788 [Elasticomyces elasticus]KAK4964996.1 hypothetical protein LTR42_012413 [Elasticomyces elasticus]
MPANFAEHEKLAARYQFGTSGPGYCSESFQVWPCEQRHLAELHRLGCHYPERHEWESPTAAQEIEDIAEELRHWNDDNPYYHPLPDKMAHLRHVSKHAKAEVAIIVLPELYLTDPGTLPSTAEKLLGPVAADFSPVMEDAILENIPIRLYVWCDWTDLENPTANLGDFAYTFKHKIRTLVLRTGIMPGQLPYTHGGIDHLLRMMPSLATLLPQLHELRVAIRADGHLRWRGKALAAPFDGTLTYRGVLEKLVAAIQAARPGRRQLLQVHFSCERNDRGTHVVIIDDHTSQEIIEFATAPARPPYVKPRVTVSSEQQAAPGRITAPLRARTTPGHYNQLLKRWQASV